MKTIDKEADRVDAWQEAKNWFEAKGYSEDRRLQNAFVCPILYSVRTRKEAAFGRIGAHRSIAKVIRDWTKTGYALSDTGAYVVSGRFAKIYLESTLRGRKDFRRTTCTADTGSEKVA